MKSLFLILTARSKKNKNMSNKFVFIAFLCFAINLFSTGHVIQTDTTNDLFSLDEYYDLENSKLKDNVTYYSYHIHVYFLQKNQNQIDEATLLRNRFIDKFHVDNCIDDCETWCPKICHWELNMDTIGYNINLIFLLQKKEFIIFLI